MEIERTCRTCRRAHEGQVTEYPSDPCLGCRYDLERPRWIEWSLVRGMREAREKAEAERDALKAEVEKMKGGE